MKINKKKYPMLKMYGLMPGNKLEKHYANSDIFFYPSFVDTFGFAIIEAMTYDDLPAEKFKNEIVLRKHKRKMIRLRKRRRDMALLKRIKTLIAPAGVSLRKIAKVIRHNLPVEDSI